MTINAEMYNVTYSSTKVGTVVFDLQWIHLHSMMHTCSQKHEDIIVYHQSARVDYDQRT